MNKKLNYLSLLPSYGSAVLFLLLFIKSIKGKIKTKKFYIYLFSSAIVGFLSNILMVLFLKFINFLFNTSSFLGNYEILLAFVVGGYLLNLFVFVLVNKTWDDLVQR